MRGSARIQVVDVGRSAAQTSRDDEQINTNVFLMHRAESGG